MAIFILIHGSFHAAWNWHKVTPLLEIAGHSPVAMDMPGHGLDPTPLAKVSLRDCVKKVVREIDKHQEKVILVAHSRNGMVISQVAELRPGKIKHLVYLAAYLVPNGKSMMDFGMLDRTSLVYQNVIPRVSNNKMQKVNKLFRRILPRFLLKVLTPAVQRAHRLSPEVYSEALYHDCPAEVVALAEVMLSAEPNFPGFEPLKLSQENYGSVSKIYIECLEDRAVTLKLQRLMQKESPCDQVFQLNSSHSPFFSMPGKLVEILQKLA